MREARKVVVALAWALSLLSSAAFSDVRPLVQMGANQGLIAVGAATVSEKYIYGASIGITPSVSSAGVISQFNLESAITLFRGDEIFFMLGPTVLINASSETFFKIPARYPDGYYPQNSLFFALQATAATKNGYFVKLSMLDYFFEVLSRNPRAAFSNFQAVSLGFGKAV